MEKNKIVLSEKQKRKLEDLWFIYGNHGLKFSMRNHLFIQKVLVRGEDWREFYKPSEECLEDVDKVLLGGGK